MIRTYLGRHLVVPVLVGKEAVAALVFGAPESRDSLSFKVEWVTREGAQVAADGS